jgi:hypothetical protein
MVKNFKKRFNGNYGIKLTPDEVKALCEVDWPALGVGWLPEGSVNKTVVNEVYRVIVGRPGYPGQFPYIECWQDAVLSRPTWLKPCLEEAYRIMVANVTTTSKCREKTKEPILAKEPEEIPSPYVPLYPPPPPAPSSTPLPLTLDGEAQGTISPVKSGPEAPRTPTPMTSPSPTDLMSTLSLPVLSAHPPFDREHLTSLCEDTFSSDSCCPADAPEGSPEPNVL